jgi:hypothetical protein
MAKKKGNKNMKPTPMQFMMGGTIGAGGAKGTSLMGIGAPQASLGAIPNTMNTSEMMPPSFKKGCVGLKIPKYQYGGAIPKFYTGTLQVPEHPGAVQGAGWQGAAQGYGAGKAVTDALPLEMLGPKGMAIEMGLRGGTALWAALKAKGKNKRAAKRKAQDIATNLQLDENTYDDTFLAQSMPDYYMKKGGRIMKAKNGYKIPKYLTGTPNLGGAGSVDMTGLAAGPTASSPFSMSNLQGWQAYGGDMMGAGDMSAGQQFKQGLQDPNFKQGMKQGGMQLAEAGADLAIGAIKDDKDRAAASFFKTLLQGEAGSIAGMLGGGGGGMAQMGGGMLHDAMLIEGEEKEVLAYRNADGKLVPYNAEAARIENMEEVEPGVYKAKKGIKNFLSPNKWKQSSLKRTKHTERNKHGGTGEYLIAKAGLVIIPGNKAQAFMEGDDATREAIWSGLPKHETQEPAYAKNGLRVPKYEKGTSGTGEKTLSPKGYAAINKFENTLGTFDASGNPIGMDMGDNYAQTG